MANYLSLNVYFIEYVKLLYIAKAHSLSSSFYLKVVFKVFEDKHYHDDFIRHAMKQKTDNIILTGKNLSTLGFFFGFFEKHMETMMELVG